MAQHPSPSPGDRAARAQRRLERLVVLGGVLVAVGLTTAVVLVALSLAGADVPGTWAYLVAMLAPLGFLLLLVGLVGVAIGRRSSATGDNRRNGSSAAGT